MRGEFYSLYKPCGISSFKFISQFRKENDIKKIGHMGTLDPLAEGILPVATDEATRLIQYVDLLPKIYEAEIYFGENSDTLDREPFLNEDGSLKKLSKIEQNFLEDDLRKVLGSFLGKIEQVPPIFSAVHVDGKRAYDLARKGELEKNELKSRKVECFKVELLSLDWPIAKVRVEVGSGFYIRSLIRDVAGRLQVPAFMLSLKRLKVGEFDCENNKVKKLDWQKVLTKLKQFKLTESEFEDLRNGRRIKLSNNNYEDAEIVLGIFKNQLVSVLIFEKDAILFKPKNNFTLI